jgi:hypothetical protein
LSSTPTELPRTSAAPTSATIELGSAAAIAVIAAASLVYISGTFLIAEALGVKRLLQALLAVPIVLVASYFIAVRARQLLDPLIGFVVLKTIAELAFRGTAVDVFDDIASLFALIVMRGASPRAVATGARLLSGLAGMLALMALAQWLALFLQPDLFDELLTVNDEGKITGTPHHVIALLGLATGETYTLFGHTVSRLQSFGKEPSLNLVYFLIPSAIAFIRGGTAGIFWGCITLSFCVLSLSGSVLLSLAFGGVAWVALRLVSVKKILVWGPLLLLGAYVAALGSGGLSSVVSFISFLSDYGDFMSKEKSFSARAGGAASSLSGVASSPLGSPTLPELPAPWMINGVLLAGWLGAFMLVLFVWRLAKQLDILYANRGRDLSMRAGILILIGTLATVITFNDYQMSNYPGLVLLGLVYRMIEARNDTDRNLRYGVTTPRPPPDSHPGTGSAGHAAKAL